MLEAAALRVVVTADTSKAESGLKNFSSGMKNAAGQFGAVGALMSAAIVTPLIGIGVGAVKTAATFERSMNVLGQVSDATAAQMQAMSDQALQLGADTVFSANEAAAGMVELAKAGMDTEDVMSAIPGVMDLAAAGAISVEEAAGLAAATINTFGLEASKTTEVADMLAAAANASSADVRDLAFGVQNAGSVFAASGQNVETLATMMALLANNGLNASDAATSLKTMTMRLTAPTAAAAKAMKNLGIQVFDADGNMRDYRDIVADMEAATRGMSDAQQAAAFNTIFGADAIRAANILAAEGVTAYDEMAAAVGEQGAAAQMAAAQNSGLSGAMEQIGGSLETLFTKLALPFMDDIAAGIDKGTELVNKIGELPEPVQKAALGFLGFAVAIGLAAAAAAAAPAVIGALVSPIGLVALATLGVGLAAAAAWAMWETNWGDIQGKTEEVIGVIQPLIDGLVANLTTMWDTLGKVAMGEETEAPTFDFDFGGIAEQITQMVTDITDAVNKLDVTTIDWWTLLNDLIVEPIGAAMAVMGFSAETLTNLVTAVQDAIIEIPWGDLGGALTGLRDAVITQLGIVVNDIISDLTPLFFLLSLSVGEQVRLLKEQFAAATPAEPIAPPEPVAPKPEPLPKVPSFTSLAIEAANNMMQGITDALMGQSWTGAGKSVVDGIIDGVTRAFTVSGGIVAAAAQWAVEIDTAFSKAMLDLHMPDALTNLSKELGQWLTDTAAQLDENFMDMIGAFDRALTNFLTGVRQAIIDQFHALTGIDFGRTRPAAYTEGLFMGRPEPEPFAWPEFPTFTWPEWPPFKFPEFKWPTVPNWVERLLQWGTGGVHAREELEPGTPPYQFMGGKRPSSQEIALALGIPRVTTPEQAPEGPDWATIIKPPDWTLIILPLDWATYVVNLTWETFVTTLDWATYVLMLEWNSFVTTLDWASYVLTLEWNSFVTDINWSRYIDDVSWGSYIPTLDWGRFIPAFGRGGGGGDTDPAEEVQPMSMGRLTGRTVTSGGINITVNVATLNNDWDLETLATKVANKFRQKMS